jgi:hypothetical protein
MSNSERTFLELFNSKSNEMVRHMDGDMDIGSFRKDWEIFRERGIFGHINFQTNDVFELLAMQQHADRELLKQAVDKDEAKTIRKRIKNNRKKLRVFNIVNNKR